ncbi:MAG: hypothetical protein Q8N21_05220 [bacterium]|nr:hypothetical protein [bacterium]
MCRKKDECNRLRGSRRCKKKIEAGECPELHKKPALFLKESSLKEKKNEI